MAVLVQRVSGSYQGDYFFPAAAGVGYSYSAYRWRKDMDPSAGLLRIVAGLGTRAVDRTERDYPRLSGLDRPEMSMHVTAADKHRFCQRNMDVLDIRGNCLKTVPTEELLDQIPLWLKKEVMERDYEAEDALKRMNRPKQVWFVTCQHLLENQEFTKQFGEVARKQTEFYGACTSIRVWYRDGLEVEFGLVNPTWIALPLEAGTRKVLQDGYRVLVDKKGYFQGLKL